MGKRERDLRNDEDNDDSIPKKAKKSKKEKKHKKAPQSEKEKIKEALKYLGKDEKSVKKKKNRMIDCDDITMDDYFVKMNDFKLWLKQDRKQRFEDLDTKETHHYFSKFCKKWNSGDLKSMYYEGVPESLIEASKKTKYKWSFKSDSNTMRELEATKDAVFYATEKGNSTSTTVSSSSNISMKETKDQNRSARYRVSKLERKQFNRDHKDLLEELVPKATGREAQIEKKKQQSSKRHGASKYKDDAIELDDATLMGHDGGAKGEIARRDARKRVYEEKRKSEKSARYQAAMDKEADKMAAFKASLGITTGQKITIAKRNP